MPNKIWCNKARLNLIHIHKNSKHDKENLICTFYLILIHKQAKSKRGATLGTDLWCVSNLVCSTFIYFYFCFLDWEVIIRLNNLDIQTVYKVLQNIKKDLLHYYFTLHDIIVKWAILQQQSKIYKKWSFMSVLSQHRMTKKLGGPLNTQCFLDLTRLKHLLRRIEFKRNFMWHQELEKYKEKD